MLEILGIILAALIGIVSAIFKTKNDRKKGFWAKITFWGWFIVGCSLGIIVLNIISKYNAEDELRLEDFNLYIQASRFPSLATDSLIKALPLETGFSEGYISGSGGLIGKDYFLYFNLKKGERNSHPRGGSDSYNFQCVAVKSDVWPFKKRMSSLKGKKFSYKNEMLGRLAKDGFTITVYLQIKDRKYSSYMDELGHAQISL